VRVLGVLVDIDTLGEGHPAGVDLEDLGATLLVRNANLYLAVESATAPQRGVECVHTVGRTDHHDLVSLLETVHQGEQLCDDPSLHVTGCVVTLRRDGVDLVDKHHRGRVLGGLLEHLAELFLGLTVVLRHYLRPGDVGKVGVDLVCDRAGHQCLPGAGRPLQEHTFWRLDTELLEQLRVTHRQLYHLPDLLEFRVQSADILVGDVRTLGLLCGPLGELLGRPLTDLDLRRIGDNDGSTGFGLRYLQRHLLTGHRRQWSQTERDWNGLVFRDSLPAEVLPDHRGNVATHPEILRERDGQPGGRPDVRLFHGDRVVDTGSGLTAQTTVDTDNPSGLVLGVARPDPGDCPPV
jgi:hypothetical protein